jgi:hypothetical protein
MLLPLLLSIRPMSTENRAHFSTPEIFVTKHRQGRAVAEAVPTAAARVRVRAACGVFGGQSGTGAGFLRVLRFPLPIIQSISPSS